VSFLERHIIAINGMFTVANLLCGVLVGAWYNILMAVGCAGSFVRAIRAVIAAADAAALDHVLAAAAADRRRQVRESLAREAGRVAMFQRGLAQ